MYLLKKRQLKAAEAAGGTIEELSLRLREKSPNGHRIELFDDTWLMENLNLVNAYYDKNLPGGAVSRKRFFGRAITLFKRIYTRCTSWYVNPALDSQRNFNAYTTRSINEIKRYLDHLQINEDILNTIIHRDLALFRANILFLNRYLERRMIDFEAEIIQQGDVTPDALKARQSQRDDNGESEQDSIIASLDVLTLEQRVHGSPRMVKERQKMYLDYVKDCNEVLALGCGRGELLQLLEAEGIHARGTETNATLVGYCQDHGLEVERSDPLEYLAACEDRSLDAIVLARFAGHQPPRCVVTMLKLCRQKLSSDGLLIIETPNPFSLYAVSSYALEESRAHPLHPETLKLLCLSYGFLEPVVMFMNPLPPEEGLQEIDAVATGAVLDAREQELFHQVDNNFRKINRILFSHRDYALVTKRGNSGEK